MAKYTYRCPSCNEKFTISLTTEPRFCPLCGFDTADEQQKDQERLARMLASQTPPHYAHKTIRSVVDNTYRDMETTSEARAATAAEAAGVDVSEMSALKITNMNDSLRTGDIAHANLIRESQVAAANLDMAAGGDNVGATRNPEVINPVRAGVSSGPVPRAGMGMLQRTQQHFFGRTPEHISAKQ